MVVTPSAASRNTISVLPRVHFVERRAYRARRAQPTAKLQQKVMTRKRMFDDAYLNDF